MNSTKTLKIILAVVLGAFALYIFFNPPSSQNSGVTTVGSNDTIQATVDTTSVCMDFNKYNPSTLKTGLIRDMVSIYRNTQLQSIEGSTTNAVKGDAYSVWFDLDTIKKFIYHIEKGVQKNGDITTNKLGLRFYYAAYPNKMFWGKGKGYDDLEEFTTDASKAAYENKHTIIMIPTIDNGKNIIDFNPFDKLTYTNGLTKLDEPFNGEPSNNPISKIPVMALTGAGGSTAGSIDGKTAAKNHGILVPPGQTIGLSF